MNNNETEKNFKKWIPIIQKCRNSGIGVRPWCRENNVKEKQFYYWERRIKEKDSDTLKRAQIQNQTNFVEVPVSMDSSISQPTFRTDIVIHMGNNVLEISNTVSENLLSIVLKVMANVK